MTASPTGDRPLEDYPELFGILLKRLSAGLDAEYDAGIIKSFSEHFCVSTRYVIARMKTYIHYDTSRLIH